MISKADFPMTFKEITSPGPSSSKGYIRTKYTVLSIQVKILLFKNVKPVFQTFTEKLLIKNSANCKKAHTVLKFGKFRTENGNRKDRKWKLS